MKFTFVTLFAILAFGISTVTAKNPKIDPEKIVKWVENIFQQLTKSIEQYKQRKENNGVNSTTKAIEKKTLTPVATLPPLTDPENQVKHKEKKSRKKNSTKRLSKSAASMLLYKLIEWLSMYNWLMKFIFNFLALIGIL